MKFIKVFSALLLLISSDCFSFSNSEVGLNPSDYELYDTSNLATGSNQVYDCHLSIYNYITKIPSLFKGRDLYFFSAYFENRDREYLFYSYLILPSFGLDKILFPFHSFL